MAWLFHARDLALGDGDALHNSCPSCVEMVKDKVVFGRGSPKQPVDVCLSISRDEREVISRCHAEITRSQNGQYFVKDLKSMNGTFVNGRAIDVHMLQEGDVVQFGGASKMAVGQLLKTHDINIKYRFSTTRQKRKRSVAGPGPGVSRAQQGARDSMVQRLESGGRGRASSGGGQKASPRSCSPRATGRESALPRDVRSPPNSTRSNASSHSSSSSSGEKKEGASRTVAPRSAEGGSSGGGGGSSCASAGAGAGTSSSSRKKGRSGEKRALNSGEWDDAGAPTSPRMRDPMRTPGSRGGGSSSGGMGSMSGLGGQLLQSNLTRMLQTDEVDAARTILRCLEEAHSEREREQQRGLGLPRHTSADVSELMDQMRRMTATLAGTPLQERNGANRAPIPHAHTQQPPPLPVPTATAAAAAVSSRRGVDVDTLESSLCCALCSQLLLDAVVAPCSHGFCLACLEKHIQCGDDCCPCCEDPAPVLRRKDHIDVVYHRSNHLDNLVWLLLESADASLKDSFARRELADRAYMQGVLSVTAHFLKREAQAVAVRSAVRTPPGSASKRQRRGEGDVGQAQGQGYAEEGVGGDENPTTQSEPTNMEWGAAPATRPAMLGDEGEMEAEEEGVDVNEAKAGRLDQNRRDQGHTELGEEGGGAGVTMTMMQMDPLVLCGHCGGDHEEATCPHASEPEPEPEPETETEATSRGVATRDRSQDLGSIDTDTDMSDDGGGDGDGDGDGWAAASAAPAAAPASASGQEEEEEEGGGR